MVVVVFLLFVQICWSGPSPFTPNRMKSHRHCFMCVCDVHHFVDITDILLYKLSQTQPWKVHFHVHVWSIGQTHYIFIHHYSIGVQRNDSGVEDVMEKNTCVIDVRMLLERTYFTYFTRYILYIHLVTSTCFCGSLLIVRMVAEKCWLLCMSIYVCNYHVQIMNQLQAAKTPFFR